MFEINLIQSALDLWINSLDTWHSVFCHFLLLCHIMLWQSRVFLSWADKTTYAKYFTAILSLKLILAANSNIESFGRKTIRLVYVPPRTLLNWLLGTTPTFLIFQRALQIFKSISNICKMVSTLFKKCKYSELKTTVEEEKQSLINFWILIYGTSTICFIKFLLCYESSLFYIFCSSFLACIYQALLHVTFCFIHWFWWWITLLFGTTRYLCGCTISFYIEMGTLNIGNCMYY